MEKKYKEFKRLIEKADSILVLSHRGPDMDAFCSMLLVKEFLNIYYPNKKVVVKSKKTPSFNIPRMHDINLVKKLEEGDEDLIIIVDANDIDLTVDQEDTISSTKKTVVSIDHHQTISKEAALSINEFTSSATEQVIVLFRGILGKRFKLTNEIADLGQYGINADTGRFLYETTTPQTLRLFADLFEFHPVDIEEVTYKIGKIPQESSDVVAFLLKRIQTVGDMAYTYISKEDVLENNWDENHVGEAVSFVKNNYIRFLHGIHWGFILKPSFKEDGAWWLAFRSTKGYQEVDKIAELFGGGGHKYASGTNLQYPVDVNIDEILRDILEKMDNHIQSN